MSIGSPKTNAVRLLETLGLAFELRTYEVDPTNLDAEHVAREVAMDPASVFKTLLARGDRTGPLFAVVPADCELDLKAAARASGNRSVELVALKEVQPLTGYVRGGVTAMCAKKDYPVVVDETVVLFDQIAVSAGMRGMQIVLHPDAYVAATRATIAAIARPKSG